MGLFTFLLGWRKLLNVKITFGDSNRVSVVCDATGATIPGTEYIRLWLQYTANIMYLLGQVGSGWPEQLLGVIAILGDEPLTPDSNVFPIVSNDLALLYTDEIDDPDVRIRAKYYTKGSVFRMIKIGTAKIATVKPEIMLKSVPALFQFAMSQNREDRESLDTLFYAARFFLDYCESEGYGSPDSMAQAPNQVLIAAAATAHAGETDT